MSGNEGITGRERREGREGREMSSFLVKPEDEAALPSYSINMENTPHISSIVKLNIGGSYFTTNVQTLTKDPNTMLAAMFSGKFEMKPCEDGAFFIDRDGTHFRFILNYLRTGKLTLPEGAIFPGRS